MFSKKLKSQLIATGFNVCINPIEKKYFGKADIITIDNREFLKLQIYKDNELHDVVYCDRDNNEFLMYRYKLGSWSVAVIYHYYWNINYKDYFGYADIKSSYIGAEYFDTPGNTTLQALIKWQQKCKGENKTAIFENKQKKTNEIMSYIKELPNDVYKYVNNHVLIESRYIYYKPISKKEIDIFCSECREWHRVKRPAHLKGQLINQKMTCPNCKSRCILKSAKRSSNITDRGTLVYTEVIPYGLCFRKFSVAKSHSNYSKPYSISMYEYERRIYNYKSDLWSSYYLETKHFAYAQSKEYWKKSKYEYNDELTGALYTTNLNRILKNTNLQYSGLYEYTKGMGVNSNIRKYIDMYKNYGSVIEKITKGGFSQLAHKFYSLKNSSIINIEPKSNKLHEILGITKEELRQLRKIKIQYSEFEGYIKLKRKGDNISVKDIQLFRKINSGINIYSIYQMVSKHISVKSFVEYIKKQGYKEAVNDYCDYIRDCKTLNYDLRDTAVLKPYDLIKVHERTNVLVQVKSNKAENEKIKKLYKENNETYTFEDDNYVITLPPDVESLIVEGKKLSHCVGNYAKIMADGNCIILLVRKKDEPDTPFVTAEIRDNKKMQIRGYRNCTPDDTVMKFWGKYEKKVLNKIKRDKKLRKVG